MCEGDDFGGFGADLLPGAEFFGVEGSNYGVFFQYDSLQSKWGQY